MQYHNSDRRSIKRIFAYVLIIVVLSGLVGYLIARWRIEEPTIHLTLSWETNPEPVAGYQVFTGMHPKTSEMIKIQEINPQDGDRQEVSWTVEELGVAGWPQVCFRVKAFNAQGMSDFSEAVCTTP